MVAAGLGARSMVCRRCVGCCPTRGPRAGTDATAWGCSTSSTRADRACRVRSSLASPYLAEAQLRQAEPLARRVEDWRTLTRIHFLSGHCWQVAGEWKQCRQQRQLGIAAAERAAQLNASFSAAGCLRSHACTVAHGRTDEQRHSVQRPWIQAGTCVRNRVLLIGPGWRDGQRKRRKRCERTLPQRATGTTFKVWSRAALSRRFCAATRSGGRRANGRQRGVGNR